MMFQSKNLNWFTPKVLAGIFLLFGIAQIAGMAWPSDVWFSIGLLRFSAMSVISIILAGAILFDARH